MLIVGCSETSTAEIPFALWIIGCAPCDNLNCTEGVHVDALVLDRKWH